mmetsp:Transcript_34735/g.87909  ORF Transcript_34735/g.87909 Transcript_34735/m.87909 type:complete len:243 (-) Transcript_34735:224-952(-)
MPSPPGPTTTCSACLARGTGRTSRWRRRATRCASACRHPPRPTALPSARTALGSAATRTTQRRAQTMPASCCTWRGTRRPTSLQPQRQTACTCTAHEGKRLCAAAHAPAAAGLGSAERLWRQRCMHPGVAGWASDHMGRQYGGQGASGAGTGHGGQLDAAPRQSKVQGCTARSRAPSWGGHGGPCLARCLADCHIGGSLFIFGWSTAADDAGSVQPGASTCELAGWDPVPCHLGILVVLCCK